MKRRTIRTAVKAIRRMSESITEESQMNQNIPKPAGNEPNKTKPCINTNQQFNLLSDS